MKPVDQTIYPTDDHPMLGNCFSACVASLLELPIEDVPNFSERGDDWWDATQRWLRERGWSFQEADVSKEWPIGPLASDQLMIATGKTNRHPTRLHSVICRANGLGNSCDWIHDPHKDKTFLTEVEQLGWLIPLDPGRAKFH